jgi:hypothetical protein
MKRIFVDKILTKYILVESFFFEEFIIRNSMV